MPRPPLPDTKKPDQGERKTDNRHRHREANLQHQIRSNQGIEFGMRGRVFKRRFRYGGRGVVHGFSSCEVSPAEKLRAGFCETQL